MLHFRYSFGCYSCEQNPKYIITTRRGELKLEIYFGNGKRKINYKAKLKARARRKSSKRGYKE